VEEGGPLRPRVTLLRCKTLRALPVILGNCVIIGGIVLAILTARDNIFSAPELSSGKFDFNRPGPSIPPKVPPSQSHIRPPKACLWLLGAEFLIFETSPPPRCQAQIQSNSDLRRLELPM